MHDDSNPPVISAEGYSVIKNDLLPPGTLIVSPDVFKALNESQHQQTQRELALLNKVKSHYKKTRSCSNKMAYKLQNQLRFWVAENGYTQAEFNQAKRQVEEGVLPNME